MINTSESDLESGDNEDKIDSDSETDSIQNDNIKTVVIDGVRVQIIILLKDDNDDEIFCC